MANQTAPGQKRNPDVERERPRALKFDTVLKKSSPAAAPWTKLRRDLGRVLDAGRNVVGDLYASAAKVVFERVEEFEDRHAERKDRQRIAARAARRKI